MPLVGANNDGTGKDSVCIGKIDSMLSDIMLILGLIPLILMRAAASFIDRIPDERIFGSCRIKGNWGPSLSKTGLQSYWTKVALPDDSGLRCSRVYGPVTLDGSISSVNSTGHQCVFCCPCLRSSINACDRASLSIALAAFSLPLHVIRLVQ